MSVYEYDLICIGSGPAGQRAAIQAAKLNKRVAVIERQRWAGGVCVDRGTIPSKTFREAVLSYTGYNRRFHQPLEGSVWEKVTSNKILKEVIEVVRNESRIVENQLRRNHIELKRGVASFNDVHEVKVSSEYGTSVLTGDKILIACGSKPALFPGADQDRDVLVTSDDMPFLTVMPHTMTVIGGGVIGMEYASIFAALGIEVTVVDRRHRPLEFLDHEIVNELKRQMQEMNVTFFQEESVQDIETEKNESHCGIVYLQSGKKISSDIILYSVGRVGATGDLNLDTIGLSVDDLGRLKVNKFFQTEISNIYAAGDVIGFPSLAATSSEQGRLAARHAFMGGIDSMSEYFPSGIYSIPEISMVGKTEQDLKSMEIPYVTGVARYQEIARGQILGDDSGMLKLLFALENRQLLGVHAIGTGATELIHIGQAVLCFHGSLDYFLQTVFNYPTLAECYKVAAWDAENKFT